MTGAGDEFDRLSENLNAMLGRIATLNEGLKQVSDNIAHDLKTPLTRLRNRAEAALAGKARRPNTARRWKATIAESDQLIRTFNAILMISRLEAGYSAESVTKVDLADAVRDVVELYEPAAEDVGVVLETAVDGSVRGRRQPRTDRPGAFQRRRQCHQIFRRSVGKAARDRVAGEFRPARSGSASPTTARAFPTKPTASAPPNGSCDWKQSRSQPGSGLGLSLAKAVMTLPWRAA